MKLLLTAAVVLCAACAPEPRDSAAATSDTAATQHDSIVARTEVARMGCTVRTVTGAGIGALRIGATVDSVRTQCMVARDTVVMGVEGSPGRIVAVAFGVDTIQAEVVDGRVWRIDVGRAGFTTADSLGVGSTLGELLRYPGATAAAGEGKLFVLLRDHCGLSFRLATRPGDLARAGYDEAGLRALPSTTLVDRILIVGCRTPSS